MYIIHVCIFKFQEKKASISLCVCLKYCCMKKYYNYFLIYILLFKSDFPTKIIISKNKKLHEIIKLNIRKFFSHLRKDFALDSRTWEHGTRHCHAAGDKKRRDDALMR